MIKLILTDMDGTVVDSMGVLSALGVALLSTYSSTELDESQRHYDATVGRPFEEQVREWSGDAMSERSICRLSEAYEMVHRSAAPFFPFTPFGSALANHPANVAPYCQFALVTSSHRRIVDAMPQLHTIPWSYVGGYRGDTSTNKPMQMAEAMKVLNIFHPEVCYVGDSPSDEQIAALCGMPFFHPSATTLDEIMQYDADRGESGESVSGAWTK